MIQQQIQQGGLTTSFVLTLVTGQTDWLARLNLNLDWLNWTKGETEIADWLTGVIWRDAGTSKRVRKWAFLCSFYYLVRNIFLFQFDLTLKDFRSTIKIKTWCHNLGLCWALSDSPNSLQKLIGLTLLSSQYVHKWQQQWRACYFYFKLLHLWKGCQLYWVQLVSQLYQPDKLG